MFLKLLAPIAKNVFEGHQKFENSLDINNHFD